MRTHRYTMLVACMLLPLLALAQSVQLAPIGESTERHLVEPFSRWTTDPQNLRSEQGDRFEIAKVAAEEARTIKVKNVVPPIHFESGKAQIPPEYVEKVRAVLKTMQGKRNVRLHLVGHADNQPLSETLVRTFGDNAGLSRERAGEVAEFLKRALRLPSEAIVYEWAGDTQPVATNDTLEGRALNRRVEVEVWYDEMKDALKDQEVLVKEEIKRVKVCRIETVCKLRYQGDRARRARIRNLVTPLHYDDETIQVTPEFTKQIEQALTNLREKGNVEVKFIGFADDGPLSARNERIYGDALALSKARARRVALAVQEALKLPTSAIATDGLGAALPIASNATDQGRALNRRVEVEFWHDDPLQSLPDEPQLCPLPSGEEVVTKVYDPPWGKIAPLSLEGGNAVIPAGYTDDLRRALTDVAEKTHARIRFIGYTKNERLDRRTAIVYGDDIGLSAARARRAMDTLREQMGLQPSQVEHEGRGYVQSDDVVNAGFIQGETSYIAVQVVYDEPAPLDSLDGVDVDRLTRELKPKDPYALNLMRITVDGEPIDDPARGSADLQRCTDVALDKANIQFQFDNLKSAPRLGVTATPAMIAMRPIELPDPSQSVTEPDPNADSQVQSSNEEIGSANDDAVQGAPDTPAPKIDAETPRFVGLPVAFKMYINYSRFIDRAEIRIFDANRSSEALPLAVLPVDVAGNAEWQPSLGHIGPPARELQYILRVYDKKGNFDETSPQSLWVKHEEANDSAPNADTAAAHATDLVANFGEDHLSIRNIPLGSGTVKVHGSGIPPLHSVWVAGREVPVDASGNFVAEEILPTGAHTVEVSVLDPAGNGNVFLRDLEFKRDDWFYVGLADVTWSNTHTTGPADLLQGDNPREDFNSTLDGRLAFFLNGKFAEHWKLTASADTREGPLNDLFSNFMSKTPESLFRRIDPDYYYPTFGDDSVVEELAPTLGKFYVKVSEHDNFGMWGNFNIGYMANELAQVDRGLYGANLHYGSELSTSFGERRYMLDGFAAEPGTIPSREEFRGTGGSLYFLKRQDILIGSERLRVELRDKDSGIVNGVVYLRPGLDYDIDYLQGRVVLSEPLSSTADDNLLIRSSGLSGDEAFLVVRYEYTPGFDQIDALSTGGQGHVWITDYLKLGVTTNRNDDSGAGSTLNAADLTLRMSADTWFKVQAGKTEGLLSNSLVSDDGGFAFSPGVPPPPPDASANAYRADVSVGLNDFLKNWKGRLNLYAQSQDAGYSAPGFNTLTDTKHYGGRFSMPITEKLEVVAKADSKSQELGLERDARELDVSYRFTDHWSLSTGVRNDVRKDNSPIVPVTQDQGERTDAVVQVGYDSKGPWRAYGFAQDTVSSRDGREENNRVGTGGSYRFTDRFRIDGEVSGGDLGPGARLGTNYLYSERTNLYLNYALENERTDNGLQSRRGNLISGVKRRFSDSSSVFLEERYQDSDTLTGLTHSTGVNFKVRERWNFGVNADIGTLKDDRTGAETKRRAGGARVGYGFDSLQIASGVEYRKDETEQLDATVIERTTWLFRNSFKLQLTPDWRMLGKFNHSKSDSTQGDFYGGGYTEGVVGYGYRPVRNDRLDVLAKYTYFYNVPTTDQVTPRNTAAEFIQKSHIAAIDATYDLTPHWSLGGKYAYRVGSVSLDRSDPQFFDNNAQLYVARVDWRFRGDWETLIEARMLKMSDLNEERSGYLTALYRKLGNHVKVGAGYNFTQFSDDLTDLSFDHGGVFVNVVGTL